MLAQTKPYLTTGVHVHICAAAIQLFMSRSTCIPLYPATDGQQTVVDIQATR